MDTATPGRGLSVRAKAGLSLGALILCFLNGVGCERSTPTSTQPPTGETPSSAVALSGAVTVSTAASMTDVISELGSRFSTIHAGVTVLVNSGSTNQLATQIEAGAPVDVFVSADSSVLHGLMGKNLIAAETMKSIAGNALALVSQTNGLAAGTFADFAARESVTRIALGNPETVPAGRYAKTYLTELGVWDLAESKAVFGESVRQALDYVVRGEAQVGIVYLTDAKTEPEKLRVLATHALRTWIYDIAVVAGTQNEAAARGFAEFVAGPEGSSLLKERGFVVE